MRTQHAYSKMLTPKTESEIQEEAYKCAMYFYRLCQGQKLDVKEIRQIIGCKYDDLASMNSEQLNQVILKATSHFGIRQFGK